MALKTIKNKLTHILATNVMLFAFLVSGLVASVALPSTVDAATTTGTECSTPNVTFEGGVKCAQPKGVAEEITGQGGIFQIVANILLFIVGAVAVIMLIIGGLRYVTSNGDQNAVTGAKNTIMYAIIGIVVAFLAYAAVNFVVAQLSAGTTTT